jgi:hypothetical protein
MACPTCGRAHPGHAGGASGPHYCSIACYRTGQGLDDPATGDGRRWCEGCRRYLDADDGRWCSDACRVADWRRRQPQQPPSPPRPRRAANIDAMGLDAVMTEHAPARYTDHTSATIVDDAAFSLAVVRGLQAVGDAGATLHALASLAAQIDELLPAAVTQARDQDYTWSEIAALLAVSRDRAQRLAAHHNPTRRTPLTD